MQKNNTISFSPIRLFLMLFFAFSVSMNIMLMAKYLELKTLTNNFVEPMFSLVDQEGKYTIKKREEGYFSVEYTTNEDNTKAIVVGSSQVPLDQYIDKNVHIIGEFRKVLGTPTCFTKCERSYKVPVLDIKNIETVE